mgnify:FL=1
MENKIVAVEYLPALRELEVKFSSGARLGCPIDALNMLKWTGSEFSQVPQPTDQQLSNVRIWAGGYAIDFPDIEQNYDVDELLALLPINYQLAEVPS